MDRMPSPPCVAKFGLFEVDLQTGEVRKAGMRQKLVGHPVKVLQALLERPHEIVTREELRQRLWPENTFVDHDLALRKAVNRLREVLGDSTESPRFIETIPRSGYRFIGTLEAPQPQPVPSTGAMPKNSRVPWKAVGAITLLALATMLIAVNTGKLRTRIFAKSNAPEIRSIAVLPLDNLSKDPGQDYFSDGITDALTTELAQIGALRVISRTSAVRFKGTKQTLPEIGHELNVDAIVEGSVTRTENRVRITAQLVDTRTDRHLWAKAYERDSRDVLFMQDEVARDIADEIRVKLKPEERTRLAQGRSVNPEVLEACLKGRFYYEKMSIPAFQEAVNYYRQALRQDSTYAPAYVGLAAAYKELGVWGAIPPKEAASQATDAVERALALNDNSGDAHAVLGHIHFLWDWDWPGAEREYKRAFELGPPSTDTSIQYSVYLSAMGRHDEAVTVMRKARSSDPVSQPSNGLLGMMYYWSRRFDEAIEQFHSNLALHPDSTFDHGFLGRCFEQKAMYSEAVEEYLKTKTLGGAGQEELTRFRQAFVRSGMKGFLREELKSTIASSKSRYVDPFWIAILHARLRDNDQAFRWLEIGVQQRSHNLALIATEPMLDGLHSDPHFQELLRRMRLPQ